VNFQVIGVIADAEVIASGRGIKIRDRFKVKRHIN
jgi:hypothetical protein